jgi:IPT/TIG domain
MMVSASVHLHNLNLFHRFLRILQLLALMVLLGLIACGGGSGSESSGVGGGGGGGGAGGGNGSFTAGRTKYVRTDAMTEYFAWINSHWVIYNPATKRFFVTDPYSNHVMVMDAVSQTEIGVISVPGAYSIDDTPDHSSLYVGTLIGDLYAIDPVSMTVTKRYIGSQVGPNGYFVFSAVVMADGRIALLGAAGGIPSVDGSTSFALWNPSDNSITTYDNTGLVNTTPTPCGQFLRNIGGFTRTVDRTKVLITSIDSDSTLCEIDESTGQGTYVGTGASFSMVNLRTTPDGKYIIVPGYPAGVNVYDAQTLQPLAQFPVNGDSSTASGFFLSLDSKTLFTPSPTIIYAYDLATQQPTGWFPNMFVLPTGGGGAVGPISAPNLQATDGTGVFVGPLEQGVGFVDVNMMRTGTVGTQFTNGYLSLATGPTAGGTQVQLPEPNQVSSLSAMFFGSQHATNLSYASGTISATTPAGNPGPTEVWTFTTDGGFQLLPDGFSYGPTILEVSPNMSTVEGGGTGYIFGYGFGPDSSTTTVPAGLQVTVAGTPVQLTAFYSSTGGPAFRLQVVAYTIPPGVVGTADVTVTSSSGRATARAALTYLPPVQQFSLPSSTLAQGIYDPVRDVYYFTDTTKIQVFSKTQARWLSPIAISAPNGATQRLWGIALSPDGTKLAVADISAGVIYELNPTNPSSQKMFPVSSAVLGYGVYPVGVAISDAGMIYYAGWAPGVSGAHGFFKLNTNTGAVTDYGIDSPGLYSNGQPLDVFLRAVISADNSRIFFNDDGYVFSIDTASDKIFSASTDPGCCYGDYDLTLSANQLQFGASSYLYDANLNAESYSSLNNREALTAAYVYGAKLSPDGTLLFQPSSNGIDILDGRLGNLLQRISLPMALSQNYDALVIDGKDDVLIAITGVNGNGIAVVDLTSVPEPSPLPFVSRSSSRANRLVRWGRSRLVSGTKPPSRFGGDSLPIVPRIVPRFTTPTVHLRQTAATTGITRERLDRSRVSLTRIP